MTQFFEPDDYGKDGEFYFDDDQRVYCPRCDSDNVKAVTDELVARTFDVPAIFPEQTRRKWWRCQDCNYWWSET